MSLDPSQLGPWFFSVNRTSAEEQLAAMGKNAFLVRPSSVPNCYALSKYNRQDNLHFHFLISIQPGAVRLQDSQLDQHVYSTLPELVSKSMELAGYVYPQSFSQVSVVPQETRPGRVGTLRRPKVQHRPSVTQMGGAGAAGAGAGAAAGGGVQQQQAGAGAGAGAAAGGRPGGAAALQGMFAPPAAAGRGPPQQPLPQRPGWQQQQQQPQVRGPGVARRPVQQQQPGGAGGSFRGQQQQPSPQRMPPGRNPAVAGAPGAGAGGGGWVRPPGAAARVPPARRPLNAPARGQRGPGGGWQPAGPVTPGLQQPGRVVAAPAPPPGGAPAAAAGGGGGDLQSLAAQEQAEVQAVLDAFLQEQDAILNVLCDREIETCRSKWAEAKREMAETLAYKQAH